MCTNEYGVLTRVTLESLGPSFCLGRASFLTPYTPYIGFALAKVNITKLATPDTKKNSGHHPHAIVCTSLQKKFISKKY